MTGSTVVARRSWRIDALHRADAIAVRVPKSIPTNPSELTSFDDGALDLHVRWMPRKPKRPTDQQLIAYVSGRDAALRELQAELGVRMLLSAQI